MFTAKKTIPQDEVSITSGRPLLTPPKSETINNPDGESEIVKHQATVNFDIKGIKPVEITDGEYNALYIILENIAKRIPELKDIVKKEIASVEVIK